LTWVNIKIKVVVIIDLKLNSGVDSRQDSSQHKKKVIIIIVLKLDSGINPG
jgi:hypothetical protein